MNKIVNGVANDYEFPQLERITIPTESECYLGIIREYQREVERLNNIIEKAVEYIEKNLLPSHSIEKTDWEFEDVIFSDLPVEVIKPLIDILNGRSDE